MKTFARPEDALFVPQSQLGTNGDGYADDAADAEPLGRIGPATEVPCDQLPVIVARGRQLPEVTAEAVAALAAGNDPPTVFVRGGSPVRVRVADDGSHAIAHMTEAALRGQMARTARYVMAGKKGRAVEVSPPLDVVRDIAAMGLNEIAGGDGPSPFPVLEAITTIPVLRPDGTIISRPGYDAATRLYYAPSPGLDVPPIPDRPTSRDVAGAVALIDEAFGEFPYEGGADKANAIGTLVTPAVRQFIKGKSPLAITDAPQAGTGKSLMTDTMGHILTGSSPAMMGAPADDTEWRKQITATLLEGPTIIVIDNIDAPLASASLARALTSSVWSDRILGASHQVSLTNRATWIATGNNVEVGGDMPRRCYRIRLDAKSARPWRDREFRHPNLLEWVGQNRGRLVAAVLTLCRAWHVAGCPVPKDSPVIGSFEGWSKTIGGILHMAGIPGFLGNLDELYDQADDGGREWEVFLRTWRGRYGGDVVAVGRLVEDLQVEHDDGLRDALPDGLGSFVVFQPPRHMEAGKFIIKDSGRFKIRLGKQLRQRIGRRYGDEGLYLIRREDGHDKVAKWGVEVAGSAGSAGGVFTQDDGANF